jgi:hypothetical protein
MTAPEPLSAVRPELPSELCQLVEQLLAKNPQDRPKSELVASRLNQLLEGRSSGSAAEIPVFADSGSFLGSPDEAGEESRQASNETTTEDPIEEELPAVLDANWSESFDEMGPRSRLVASQSWPNKPQRGMKSAELQWILAFVLLGLLVFSIWFFIISISRFLRLFI